MHKMYTKLKEWFKEIPTKFNELKRSLTSVQGKQNLWGFLFLVPSLGFLLVFKLIPMIWAARLSFYKYDLVSTEQFVGLKNYTDLMSSEDFLTSLANSGYYVVGSVSVIVVLSLIMALVFVRPMPARNLLRMSYFIPVIMSSVVIAVVWKFLYHPFGLINSLLSYLGVHQINWLTDSTSAMPALIIIAIWRGTPYFMMIFIGGLLAIPYEYYEAARIDGATAWSAFRYITLPLLKPTTLLVIVMAVIIGMKVFINPMIITHGGPAGATRVLPLLIYQTAFSFFKMGKASAMSMIFFVIVMIFTLFQIKLFTSDGKG